MYEYDVVTMDYEDWKLKEFLNLRAREAWHVVDVYYIKGAYIPGNPNLGISDLRINDQVRVVLARETN